MEPRLSFITLGVTDFAQSVKFYRDGLGFPLSSASKGDVAFFKTGGIVLALYPSDKLAEDAHVSPEGSGFRSVTLAHNVRSREAVSEVLALAAAAGATITKPAQDTFWGGHGGYFADPDGKSSGIRFSRSQRMGVLSCRDAFMEIKNENCNDRGRHLDRPHCRQ